MSAAFARRLAGAWSAETAQTWREDDPARGQCSVTALVAQDLFGGTILKTRIGPAWHFYNRFDGARHDFTASQFAAPIAYEDIEATRAEAFADTSPAQYEALRQSLSS